MAGILIIKTQIRRRSPLLSALSLLLLTMLAIGTGNAQAARIHPLNLSEVLPNGDRPLAVAVNLTTHHIYVSALSESTNIYRVYNLDENGDLDPVHPELTGAPSFQPFFSVAVDNSGGAHAGYVYATNVFSTVQQFDPEGKATAVTITATAIPPDGTPQAGGLPPVVNKGSFEPRQVAVDGTGAVFVTDSSARAIDVFTPAGVFVKQIGSGLFVAPPTGIAIDGSDVYLTFSEPGGTKSAGLYELDATSGECVQAGCAPIDPAPAGGVAVDHQAGIIYATAQARAFQGKFSEYDAASDELLGVTQPNGLQSPLGIAVDETSGAVIVADTPVSEGTVKFFGALEILPDVVTLPPEAVTDRSATLKGEIGAAGVASGATCVIQYVDAKEFAAHGFEGTVSEPAPAAPCDPAGPFSGTAMNAVQAEVKGLRGGTTYHERILGKNLNGENPGEDISFTTKGPSVSGTEVAEVDETTATLQALVNPNASAATYAFQYLTQAQFETSGWSGAAEAPAGGETLGSGSSAIPVSQPIKGLTPDTAYRFRVVARSSSGASAGETDGAEVVFKTFAPPPSGLPDGRRYEQASPVDKDGTNVQGALNVVQASLDGDRVTFFANSGIPGGEGAQEFPTFMASRAADGSSWSTQGLLPPASYGPQAYVMGWSEDLADTYSFATRPFEPGKLLRRQSTGAIDQVGTARRSGAPLALAATSEGGATALFESGAGGLLAGDLEGKQNVYAYDRDTGQLALAGIMNNGSVPAGGVSAGSDRWFEGRLTEPGGALGHYFTQAAHTLSADGTRAFFTAGGTGQIYARLNPLAPQSEMASERCTEPAKACTVRISAPEEGVTDPNTPAVFLGASKDGNLVYFLDEGKLTSDATGRGGFDLYRYDVGTGDLTVLSIDHGDKRGARVEGMLAIGGPEGEDAYFVAAGKLAPDATEAPSNETNLYALHGTTLEYVTRLGTTGLAIGAESGDRVNWLPSASFTESSGVVANPSRLSADGQTLLFRSNLQQTPFENHGVNELYLYRSGEGIVCISCNPTGEAPAGPAGVQNIPRFAFNQGNAHSFKTRNLSADGRRVFFDSADRLLASDHNNVNDVYEWEEDGKGSCESEAIAGGCLYLISGGAEGADPSWFGDADEEGENVFFFTSQPLVAQDKDELVDVYDARVGGGIAAQEEQPSVPCEGEAACRGPVGTSPEFQTPGSATHEGSGNAGPPPPCPKGKTRKNGHCAIKHKKKHHKKKNNHRHHSKQRHGRGKAGSR
jgi:hypothetical protein